MPKPPKKLSNNSVTERAPLAPRSYEKTIALWTRILGISTILLFVATGISAYFLHATDQTINKQVDALAIQLRAYVGISDFFYVYFEPAKEADKDKVLPGARMGLKWKNSGATPALEFEYWISTKFYAEGTEPDFATPAERLSNRVTTTISPNSELSTSPVFVSTGDLNRASAGVGKIFLWGHATYRDVFPLNPPRHTHFCFVGTTLPIRTTVLPGEASVSVYKPNCNYSN